MLVLLLIAGFIVGEGLGYLIHRLFHSPISGMFYRGHMAHHNGLYPITDFYSTKYKTPKGIRNNTPLLYVPFFVVIIGALFILLPLKLFLIVGIELFVVSVVNDQVHMLTHIKPNMFEQFKWFQQLRKIHYHHHIDTDKNYGIIFFFWDRILGTFEKVK